MKKIKIGKAFFTKTEDPSRYLAANNAAIRYIPKKTNSWITNNTKYLKLRFRSSFVKQPSSSAFKYNGEYLFLSANAY